MVRARGCDAVEDNVWAKMMYVPTWFIRKVFEF